MLCFAMTVGLYVYYLMACQWTKHIKHTQIQIFFQDQQVTGSSPTLYLT